MRTLARGPSFLVHKDKPPGFFNFPARSAKHAIWMGLATGVFLSFVAHVVLVIKQADPDGSRRGMEAATGMLTAHHKEPDKATPPPPSNVKY
ncbi:MAG: hypothetical protein ABI992_02905 [Chthoniobacterales bacterium]